MTSYIVFIAIFAAAFYAGRLSAWRKCEAMLDKMKADYATRLHEISMRSKYQGVKAEKLANSYRRFNTHSPS